MRCEEARNELSAYLDGELGPQEADAVREHVASCAACREVLEELRATIDLVGALPPCEAPQGLAADVQREIERRLILAPPAEAAETAPQERLLPIRRASLWPRVMAVAATLVLAVGIGWLGFLGDGVKSPLPAPSVESPAAPASNSLTGPVAAATEPRRGAPEPAAARPADLYFEDAKTKDRPGEAGGWAYKLTPSTKGGKSLDAVSGDADRDAKGALVRIAGTVAAQPSAPTAGVEWNGSGRKAGVGEAHGDGAGKAPAKGYATFGLRDDEQPPVDQVADIAVQNALANAAMGQPNPEEMKQALSPTNLDRVSQQVVIETRSRAYANGELQRLLAANDLEPVEKAVTRTQRVDAGRVIDGDMRTNSSEVMAGEALPAGVYYYIREKAEDTYVVVTDRDNLSRFGSQLAAVDSLEVSDKSSGLLLGVRYLQQARQNLAGQALFAANGYVINALPVPAAEATEGPAAAEDDVAGAERMKSPEVAKSQAEKANDEVSLGDGEDNLAKGTDDSYLIPGVEALHGVPPASTTGEGGAPQEGCAKAPEKADGSSSSTEPSEEGRMSQTQVAGTVADEDGLQLKIVAGDRIVDSPAKEEAAAPAAGVALETTQAAAPQQEVQGGGQVQARVPVQTQRQDTEGLNFLGQLQRNQIVLVIRVQAVATDEAMDEVEDAKASSSLEEEKPPAEKKKTESEEPPAAAPTAPEPSQKPAGE